MSFSWADFDVRGTHKRSPGYAGSGHVKHRTDGTLSRSEALHWALHSRHGVSICDKLGIPPSEVADLLCEAAQMRSVGKRNNEKVPPMSNNTVKALQGMSEAQFVRIVTKAARVQFPDEPTPERAFARAFGENSPAGLAIRQAHQVVKAGPPRLSRAVGTVAMDEAGIPVMFPGDDAGGGGDHDEVVGVNDDGDAEDLADEADAALSDLESEAVELRKRQPELSQAQAFAKIYADPQFAPLVKRERSVALRRLYSR